MERAVRAMPRVGEACEVYSLSANAWLPAVVLNVDGADVHVRYTGSQGSRDKWATPAELRAAPASGPRPQAALRAAKRPSAPPPRRGAAAGYKPAVRSVTAAAAAAAAATAAAAEPAARQSLAPQPLAVGDVCEVFSASAGVWVEALVAEAVSDRGSRECRVSYAVPGAGRREKWVGAAEVRLAPPSPLASVVAVAAATTAPAPQIVGGACQVFSASAGIWVRATLLELDNGEAHVQYTILGSTREKWVVAEPSQIRAAESDAFPAAGDVSLNLSSIRGGRGGGAGAATHDATGWFDDQTTAAASPCKNSDAAELSLSPASDQGASPHRAMEAMADEVQVVTNYSAAAQAALDARLALEDAHARFVAQAEAARVEAETRTAGLLVQARADAASIIERRKVVPTTHHEGGGAVPPSSEKIWGRSIAGCPAPASVQLEVAEPENLAWTCAAERARLQEQESLEKISNAAADAIAAQPSPIARAKSPRRSILPPALTLHGAKQAQESAERRAQDVIASMKEEAAQEVIRSQQMVYFILKMIIFSLQMTDFVLNTMDYRQSRYPWLLIWHSRASSRYPTKSHEFCI